MPKAYSYVRFSSRKQALGASEVRQLEKSREWADRHGVELDTSLKPDRAISAYKGEQRVKGALGKFLSMIESGAVEAGSLLIVESLDRISRETETEAMHLFTGIARKGVTIVTLNDGATYDRRSSGMDWMRAVIVASRSHEEVKVKGGRVADAWDRKKAAARVDLKPITRMVPIWLQWEGDPRAHAKTGKIAPKPDAQQIISRIFNELEHGIGAVKIAKRLNEDGVAPFAKAKLWHPNLIYMIAKSREVLGEYQPRKAVKGARKGPPDGNAISGYFPAMVGEAQWLRVQAHIQKRAVKHGGRRGESFANLLTGIARCYECGGRMTMHRTVPSKKNRGVVSMRCTVAANGGNCSHRKYHQYTKLEASILRRIGQFIVTDEPQHNPDEADLELAINRRAHIEAEGQELAATPGLSTNKFVIARLDALASESSRLEAEIARLRKLVMARTIKAPATSHQAVVQRLVSEMATRTGPDLYALRASINEGLKGFVDWIDFDSNGDVRVIILGGLRSYLFQDGEFVRGFDATRLVNDGVMPLGQYTGGDPEREAVFRKFK